MLGVLAAILFTQPTFGPPETVGVIEEPAIGEASGIAASRRNPGVLWTHNDSGDSARVFAIDSAGAFRGQYPLPGVFSLDMEDVAVGPGPEPGVSYLFVGDIGDNLAFRPAIRVHRAPEPAVALEGPPVVEPLDGVVSITLRYPDGARDAESLAIDPLTGDAYVVSKQPGVSRVYRAAKADLDAGGPVTMSFVTELPFGLATAGDISPDGSLFVLRSLDSACVWVRSPGATIADALQGPCVPAPVTGRPAEPQGEAIGFGVDRRGYYTISEGARPPLRFSPRLDSACDADVNCDGSADQGDVACMIRAIAGEAGCFCAADPDFNADGSADQGDLSSLIRVVAGGECP